MAHKWIEVSEDGLTVASEWVGVRERGISGNYLRAVAASDRIGIYWVARAGAGAGATTGVVDGIVRIVATMTLMDDGKIERDDDRRRHRYDSSKGENPKQSPATGGYGRCERSLRRDIARDLAGGQKCGCLGRGGAFFVRVGNNGARPYRGAEVAPGNVGRVRVEWGIVYMLVW